MCLNRVLFVCAINDQYYGAKTIYCIKDIKVLNILTIVVIQVYQNKIYVFSVLRKRNKLEVCGQFEESGLVMDKSKSGRPTSSKMK